MSKRSVRCSRFFMVTYMRIRVYVCLFVCLFVHRFLFVEFFVAHSRFNGTLHILDYYRIDVFSQKTPQQMHTFARLKKETGSNRVNFAFRMRNGNSVESHKSYILISNKIHTRAFDEWEQQQKIDWEKETHRSSQRAREMCVCVTETATVAAAAAALVHWQRFAIGPISVCA